MSKKKLHDLSIAECQAEIAENEKKRSVLFEEIEPLEKKVIRLHKRNSKLKDRIAEIKSKQKKIDWDYVLSCEHSGGQTHYEYRESALRKIGLRSDGFFRETGQVCIRVCLYRNDEKSVAKTLAGLRKVLPYLKSVQDGCVIIDIFEHTLSENGIYNLWIDKKKKRYEVKKTTYGYEETVMKFDDLRKTLEYIQENHYYEC
jgi:hypothetical protein